MESLATLTVIPETVAPGAEIVLTWTVPVTHAGPYDWVGLCPLGSPLPVGTPVVRMYTAGLLTGKATWHAPLKPGPYVGVYVFANGTVIAGQSLPLTVEGPLYPGVKLTVAPLTLAPRFPVTATWEVPPEILQPSDWIGLYYPGTEDTEPLEWVYTDGIPEGSTRFILHVAGVYEVRYLTSNTYTSIATSALITAKIPTGAGIVAAESTKEHSGAASS
jgi:hypothetical protein